MHKENVFLIDKISLTKKWMYYKIYKNRFKCID